MSAMPWNLPAMDKTIAAPGSMSKIIGLYQVLLRRNLEHFFPNLILEPRGDRSVIRLRRRERERELYALEPDEDGVGLDLDWFGTSYLLSPGLPMPFTAAERRLIESILGVLQSRFRSLYVADSAPFEHLLPYPNEDLAIASYLDGPNLERTVAALEALRVAAMSTYENRRVSTGVLLLGTDVDPAAPARENGPGAPRYDVSLASLKALHRISNGMDTLYVVDSAGRLAWPVDIHRWARVVQGVSALPAPCARTYDAHARATRAGGHMVLLLTPAQEIRVFAEGSPAFAYGDGRWRLLDIPTNYAAWCEALGRTKPADLGARIFQAALNLAEQRRGALFVVLRDPDRSVPELLAPEDRIRDDEPLEEQSEEGPRAPRRAKRTLHHLVHGQTLADLDPSVLEAMAGIDGAVVTDRRGRMQAFGAILRITAETLQDPRSVQGARTTAALAASFHGPTLKVSEDGFVTMFLGGRRIWEL